jgi:hypothetical protein
MHGKHCYLGVYDIPVSGSTDKKVVTQAHSEDELPAALAELEMQKQDTNTITCVYRRNQRHLCIPGNSPNHYSCNLGPIQCWTSMVLGFADSCLYGRLAPIRVDGMWLKGFTLWTADCFITQGTIKRTHGTMRKARVSFNLQNVKSVGHIPNGYS